MSETTTLGVALIGAGIWATKALLPVILSNGKLQLKAIYSRSAKSAETLANSESLQHMTLDLYNGEQYAQLLDREDIDAVIIALPIPQIPVYAL